MPKLKTNKGTAKRFKITKKGKVLRHKGGHGHLLTHKSAKRKRGLTRSSTLDNTSAKTIRRLLPYG